MHINFDLTIIKNVGDKIYNYPDDLQLLYDHVAYSISSYKDVFESITILYNYMTKEWFSPSSENKYTATINGYPECDIEFRFGNNYTDSTGRVASFCHDKKISKARLAVFFIIRGDSPVLKSILLNIGNKNFFNDSVNTCKRQEAQGEWTRICNHPSINPANSEDSEKDFNNDITKLISMLDAFLEKNFSREYILPPSPPSDLPHIALLLPLLFC